MQQLFNKEFYVEEQNNNIKSTAFYILANITNNCNRNKVKKTLVSYKNTPYSLYPYI